MNAGFKMESTMISLDQLEHMFANIQDGPQWDMSRPMRRYIARISPDSECDTVKLIRTQSPGPMKTQTHCRTLLLASCLSLGSLGAAHAAEAAAAASQPAPPLMPAPDIRLEGSRLVWEGEMKLEHVEAFKRFIEKENVDGLELRNSPGASTFARPIFADVYKVLRDRKLRTYVRGLCASTCAAVFLAGREPTFLASKTPKIPTVLMFHAVRYKGAVDVGLTRTLVADIASIRGERARHLLLKVADENLSKAAALYIFPKPVQVDAGTSAVLFCPNQGMNRIKQCEPLPEAAFRDLGVTSAL